MRKSSEAAGQFLPMSNSEDEFFLIEFNERPTLSLAFTPNSAEIQKTNTSREAARTNRLLDAGHVALSQMKKAPNS